MRVAVLGAGLVGRRTAQILAADGIDTTLFSKQRQIAPLQGVEVRRRWPLPRSIAADVAVLATASANQVSLARRLVEAGTAVISTADGPQHIDRLIALGPRAAANDVPLVVGAAYSPGLSTLLATHLVQGMSEVSAIRTAQFGTGGPACAREHHRAMGSSGREVHGGRLRTSRGGSGRELVWFPEPAGPADCYRAGLAEPMLLHRRFPTVDRIESRQAATRRDRLSSRLPMLRAPHAEGLVGAVWVEVRGTVEGRVEHRTMAATGAQATGAAAMAAAFCHAVGSGDEQLRAGLEPGVNSPASIENTTSFMQALSTSVRLWTYDGSQIAGESRNSPGMQAAHKWKFPGESTAIATISLIATGSPGTFA